MFFGKSKNYKKNRKRFDSIVTDSRFNYFEPIFNDFEKGVEISDDEIILAYKNFASSVYSNTVAMAELHMVLVATIAVHNPNLIEELLERPMLMIYLSFGEKVGNERVVNFIRKRLLAKDAEPYGGLPNKKAMNWLKSFFPKNKELVEKVFDKVIAEEEKDRED